MHDYDIQTTLDDLGRTFEDFKKVNEERLISLEKKGHVDPIVQEKMEHLENHLDQAEKRLKQMEAFACRPQLEMGTQPVCNHTHAFMDYIRKGLDSPLQAFEQKVLRRHLIVMGVIWCLLWFTIVCMPHFKQHLSCGDCPTFERFQALPLKCL